MSTSYILGRLESELNTQVSNAVQRSWALQLVNRVAKQLYESRDLVMSLREQYFSFSTSDTQITLPYYVGHIRAARRPALNLADPIELNDMGPRYHYNSWGGLGTNTWRIKHTSPTATFITSPRKYEVYIPEAQDSDISVMFTGETSTAAQAAETVVIPAGSTSATQTKLFLSYKSISKALTPVDVFVRNVDTREVIAHLPSNQERSRYLIVNVKEDCFNKIRTPTHTCFVVEMLYKPLYIPLYADTDEFQAEGYDDIIVMLCDAELTKDMNKRMQVLSEARKLVSSMQSDFDAGQTKPLNMGPDPFMTRYTALFECHHRV